MALFGTSAKTSSKESRDCNAWRTAVARGRELNVHAVFLIPTGTPQAWRYWMELTENKLTFKTTMEISREQREGFMRLIQEAKSKRQSELQHELDKKVKEEVLPRIMQRQGIVRLVEQVKQIGSQLSDSAQKLQGMDVFGQPATLWGKILGTNEGVEDLVEKMKRPYAEQAESALKDYDRAILQVLSATHLEDVQHVVSELL